jgi:hypothetical protein
MNTRDNGNTNDLLALKNLMPQRQKRIARAPATALGTQWVGAQRSWRFSGLDSI